MNLHDFHYFGLSNNQETFCFISLLVDCLNLEQIYVAQMWCCEQGLHSDKKEHRYLEADDENRDRDRDKERERKERQLQLEKERYLGRFFF